jgi:hypothetical protein
MMSPNGMWRIVMNLTQLSQAITKRCNRNSRKSFKVVLMALEARRIGLLLAPEEIVLTSFLVTCANIKR